MTRHARNLVGHAVTYLGFTAPGGKVSLGAPTQSVRGSADAKNEFEVKGRPELSRTSHRVVSRPV